MRGHGEPATPRHLGERRLERRVLEGLDLPAAVADEMVVMVVAGPCRLEPGDTVPEVDALDEVELHKPVESAVDARQPDPRPASAEPVVDLLCRQAALLLADELDDGTSRIAAPAARLSQPAKRALDPGLRHER